MWREGRKRSREVSLPNRCSAGNARGTLLRGNVEQDFHIAFRYGNVSEIGIGHHPDCKQNRQVEQVANQFQHDVAIVVFGPLVFWSDEFLCQT